jgi:hypothetical protein
MLAKQRLLGISGDPFAWSGGLAMAAGAHFLMAIVHFWF